MTLGCAAGSTKWESASDIGAPARGPGAGDRVAVVTALTFPASGRSPDVLAEQLRGVWRSGVTRPLDWRIQQLRALGRFLDREHEVLGKAMTADLGKPGFEGWLTDVGAISLDVRNIVEQLPVWAAGTKVTVPVTLQPGRARVVPEPLGAVLVIAPWNYPVRCAVLPAAFALAAGNAVAIKPSELAPATSAALADLLPRYLDPEAVAVVEGGSEVAQSLLRQHWDHIFFTGSAAVGRLVLRAAADHLTPVTLELGGKNPAIVDATANVRSAARRLTWGKFLNAGQTCVAPDYLLVERSLQEQLIDAVISQLRKFYGPNPSRSPDLARIVNDQHTERLASTLERTRGRVVCGGDIDRARRYVAPTVVADVGWDDPLMEDEIFGPVLPVLAFDDIDEVVDRLRTLPAPLALYAYTRARGVSQRLIGETTSGSVCVNHNAVQLAVPGLPFGGIGSSGMGAYHGRYGFDTFTHRKAVLVRPSRGEIPLAYPPYGAMKRWLIRRFL
jgi:aldehyde dehydrogenase (NAD+)